MFLLNKNCGFDATKKGFYFWLYEGKDISESEIFSDYRTAFKVAVERYKKAHPNDELYIDFFEATIFNRALGTVVAHFRKTDPATQEEIESDDPTIDLCTCPYWGPNHEPRKRY